MATRVGRDPFSWLATLRCDGSLASMSDGQLLERFAAQTGAAGELAFEVLVRRHGPMVLSRCRAVLRDEHAAADAFQATFLVLARRAATVRSRDNIAPWLARVAGRIARRSRAEAARRASFERRTTPEETRTAIPAVDLGERELMAVVREEVRRLPARDQLLLRLTYWRGKTYEEAAALLALPIGTVRSRLSRVRERLRARLIRRGVAPAVAMAGSAAPARGASAALLSDALVLRTVRAASSAGELTGAVKAGIMSAGVAALVEGELTMMAAFFGKSAAVLVLLGGIATAGAEAHGRLGLGGGLSRRGEALAAAHPPAAPAAPAQPIDRDAWARRLAGLTEADWRKAFATGQELAGLPADDGLAILKTNWEKVTAEPARQQLLKAWRFANHPRLLDGLDLGMRDPSPAVQGWATTYLNELAFQDFAENFRAYKDWYAAHRAGPLSEAVTRSARRFAAEAAHLAKGDAERAAQRLWESARVLDDVPDARRAMIDAGLPSTLERWASSAEPGAGLEQAQLSVNALRGIGVLKPGEAYLRRVVLPLIRKERPPDVRDMAIRTLQGKENAWAIPILLDLLEQGARGDRTILGATAATLASFDDPSVIPTLIAAIEADDRESTGYDIGYSGLYWLTSVRYDKSHDGAWWRRWWESNKQKYPQNVQRLAIPNLKPLEDQ